MRRRRKRQGEKRRILEVDTQLRNLGSSRMAHEHQLTILLHTHTHTHTHTHVHRFLSLSPRSLPLRQETMRADWRRSAATNRLISRCQSVSQSRTYSLTHSHTHTHTHTQTHTHTHAHTHTQSSRHDAVLTRRNEPGQPTGVYPLTSPVFTPVRLAIKAAPPEPQ